MPWGVAERHGRVWPAPEPTPAGPPRPGAEPAVEPPPPRPAPAGPVLDNLAPALEHAWHPVALSRELRPGGWSQVRLLGCTWNLVRDHDGTVTVEPAAAGIRERLGLIWLATAEPADVAREVPEAADRRYVAAWLPPVRSPGPAGPLADTFLDATHGPFVHAGTIRLTGPHRGRPAGGDRRARRLQQRAGAVGGQPAGPRGGHRRPPAPAAPTDDLHLPGAVPHVPADRLGVALRQALCDFAAAGRRSHLVA